MDDTLSINEGIEPRSSDKKLRFAGIEINLFWANLFFGFLALTGQTGLNISLPLWVDSTKVHYTPKYIIQPIVSGKTFPWQNITVASEYRVYRPNVDGYFVYSFSCISFMVAVGVVHLFVRIFQPYKIGETEKKFPHYLMFLAGASDSVYGLIMTYASSGTRTPPYLQAILGNFLIPFTIVVRFIVLHHVPTRRKFLCAMAVLLGLFICLIPRIFPSVDPEEKSSAGEGLHWPLFFMLAFIPAAFMFVIEEKALKMKVAPSLRRVNVSYFLFWTLTYQVICSLCLFWTDIIPSFGFVDNISEFWENWTFGFKCFFGGAGCGFSSGVRGSLFISMYLLNYVGALSLMRFSEGATLLAIVYALVTPLGFLFWTLFREDPFGWHPAIHVKTWFGIGGLVIMIPAIYFYNSGKEDERKKQTGFCEETEKTALLLEFSSGLLIYS